MPLNSTHPGLKYEAFLFAPLGDDCNGTPLALASILGRMSLDPWDEAESLAALPADAAAEKLASLIGAMPNQPLAHAESATLVAGLMKLLPAQSKPSRPEADPIADAGAKKGRRPVTYLIWFAILCVLLLGIAFAP